MIFTISSLEFSEPHGNISVIQCVLLSGICLSYLMARVGRKLLSKVVVFSLMVS